MRNVAYAMLASVAIAGLFCLTTTSATVAASLRTTPKAAPHSTPNPVPKTIPETPYVLACDSLDQAERVGKLYNSEEAESIQEAAKMLNREVGQESCAFVMMRYKSFDMLESIPNKRGTAIYHIARLGGVTSYKAASWPKAISWKPIEHAPADQFIVLLLWGRVI